ncbi:hypothetical protein [Mycolicibacterium brumae]|uniref:Transposase DDE domain-containing protein n=1 Tax=Mycolicibacterium brumae TaxID=85968 RepID=A0A2G5P757_9MYCO|nr:hypothetical protein [Mycolicibacterium brumae]MCV7194304.1 hypothetical protein [Mycolicibacterium brumae]PIB73930.1 hypothetical protein CQY22_015000 [Mycolicibacterium brumae]RWA20264.1 hypothetical protein MBRU_15460 [Mycolicibacterium brumae DSM 44177]UWW09657.1 hypothetical protein L2Z93_002767 [Mycolicibacterium brumae]
MTDVDVAVWLVAGYALLLVAIAWGFDAMAKRASSHASRWQSGEFSYHADHDAWRCPQDQWLWPTSFDPGNRVMRYRAKPTVCNACPVKSTCTTSAHGREMSRQVDEWPHSEAGRFHRGIACVIAGLGMLLIVGQGIAKHTPGDLMVLGAALLITLAAAAPLYRHLVHTPAHAPAQHLPERTRQEDAVAAAIDKYSTRWGVRPTDGAHTGEEEREGR